MAFPTGIDGLYLDPHAAPQLDHWAAQIEAAIRRISISSIFVNVKDPQFGATGDGSTDDTGAIQAAIDYVFDLGGGIVFVPGGIYMISQLRMKSKVQLMGEGWSSILKQKDDQFTIIETGTSSGSNTPETLNDTSKAWTANQYSEQVSQPFGWNVEITSGVGAGQVRKIDFNTGGTQLNIHARDPWTTTPTTSGYRILEPIHMIVTDENDTEFVSIVDIKLDGNKANQTSLNRGVDMSQLSGTWESGDQHHFMSNVKIYQVSGDGLKTGFANRAGTYERVYVHSAGKYGFEFRGTDNEYYNLTAEDCGLSGVWQADTQCRHYGSKVFGNHQFGFWISYVEQEIVGIVAQDNWFDGIWMYDGHRNHVSGIVDRNGLEGSVPGSAVGPAGIRITKSNANIINLICLNTTNVGTGEHPQDYAVTIDSELDAQPIDNHITIRHDANHNVGTLAGVATNNVLFTNSLNKFFNARIESEKGTAGSTSDQHYMWGKAGAGSSNNPAFVIFSDSARRGGINATDGTNTRTGITIDFPNQNVEIGDPGSTTAADRFYLKIHTFNNATRPAASTIGRLIWNQDAGALQVDDGGTWDTLASTGVPTTLDDLSDVVITAAATNDLLRYNGTNWVDVPTVAYANLPTGTGTWSAGGSGVTMTLDAFLEVLAGASLNNVVTVTTTNEGFRWQKTGAPAGSNPYFVWKHNNATPPIAFLNGYDGTTTREFMRLDFAGRMVELGQGGSVYVIPRLPSLTTAERPAAATAGRFIYNSTDGNINVDTGSTWVTPGGVAALDDIGNVDLTGAASGALLQFNGTNWVDASSIAASLIGSGNLAYARMPTGAGTWDTGSGIIQFANGIQANSTYTLSGGGGSIAGASGNIAFFGAGGGAQQSITGSRGGNAALASLLTGLATLGLIADNTTA